MGIIVKIDDRGRLVIPSQFRNIMTTDYVEVREVDDKLLLIPIPDPLNMMVGKISRAKPLKDLGETAEEEAERIVKEDKAHANPRG